MIQLTRLNHGSTFFVNPDLVERVDTHVDTVVRLTSGTEFVVLETGDEIVQRIAEFRARVIALAALFSDAARKDARRAETAVAAAAAIGTSSPDDAGSDVATDAADTRPVADPAVVAEVVATAGAGPGGESGDAVASPVDGTSPWAPTPTAPTVGTPPQPGAPHS